MAKDQADEIDGGSKERAADRLFQTFVEKIESGALRDGDALPPEREIVATYGVSRTVAREAVQALASRGLVEARPRYRPIVRRPSFEAAFQTVGTMVERVLREKGGVRNMFETRILIEAALVRRAASVATVSQVSQLARALYANKRSVEDSQRFYETDQAFHRVFYEIAENPVLVATHAAFVEWLSPHWVQMTDLVERNERNFEAHQAIFDAIQNGDPDAAERALCAHLEEAWAQVRDTFE
ncbi:MAG: FadR/GntR family transcriptional regulator [Pseudomonadota bacterium]